MKKLLYVLLFVANFMVSAQSKTIDNMVKFKVKNTGAFLDDANDVDGYYFFYEVDKLNKEMREFALNILDKNLNDVALKKFEASKKTILVGSAFNNEAIMFSFFNKKEKTLTLKSFDKKAEAKEDVVITLDKKAARFINGSLRMGNLNSVLHPVKDKGFVLIIPVLEGRKVGYMMNFYPSNKNGKSWEYKFIPEDNAYHSVAPVALNKKYVVLVDVRAKGLSKIREFKTIVLNTDTGEKLFENLYDENDPKLITNSFISEDGKIYVMGQYYEPKAKVAKAQSLGLYMEQFNEKGEVLSSSRVTWQGDVSKFLPVKKNNKLKDIGFIYFHDIIKTQSGEYFAIGEQYRKTVSALGIANTILGGGSNVTQLTIKDIYVFKFDNKFNLKNVEIFEKGISRIQNPFDFGSPQLSASIIKAIGGFDFVYSQRDRKRDRFYANFIDYERGEKSKNTKSRLVFKTIIHDGGELSVDNVELPKKSRYFRVLPAKVGYVLLLEYDRKKKTSSLHLEKLNIN